jgi:hypothetical protein
MVLIEGVVVLTLRSSNRRANPNDKSRVDQQNKNFVIAAAVATSE